MAGGYYRIAHHGHGIEGMMLYDNNPRKRGRGLYQIISQGEMVEVRGQKNGDTIHLSGRRIFLDGRARDHGWSLVEWKGSPFANERVKVEEDLPAPDDMKLEQSQNG